MEQRLNIAKNLVSYRKQANLTQQELAEKLNYTDKAVSKWERGDALPDVLVLKQIADLYGVTVDDFLKQNNQSVKVNTNEIKSILRKKQLLIALLSGGLVWLVATIVFVVLGIVLPQYDFAKYIYITALPVCFIVLLVFNLMWGKMIFSALLVSALVWTLCVTLHIYIKDLDNAWLIYMIGTVMQVLVILWFLLLKVLKNRKKAV